MMEEKIRREMEDTKETIQKSNKLISSGRWGEDWRVFQVKNNVCLLQPPVRDSSGHVHFLFKLTFSEVLNFGVLPSWFISNLVRLCFVQ